VHSADFDEVGYGTVREFNRLSFPEGSIGGEKRGGAFQQMTFVSRLRPGRKMKIFLPGSLWG